MKNLTIVIAAIMLFAACANQTKEAGPAKVELKANAEGNNRLFVNGEEFFIDGAGLEYGSIEALAENGANSFRTWRTDDDRQKAIELLDEAEKNGLMVLMGLEIGRERHGYSYDDTAFVNTQRRYVMHEVERLKNHPALLGWAIGNELNLGQKDLRIYKEVNYLSEMVHKMDPNHITTTTTAGIGKKEVDYINEHCTDIDFLSIQMYGDIVNLQKRISDAGWKGAYSVTEWGATGHWEVERTDWDVAIENTSKEKAKDFINRYDLAIKADAKDCIGSYVFLWGQKQERTPTWYGMFLTDGSKTETVDAMHYIWKGRWPEDRCPALDSIRINGKTAYESIKLKSNESATAFAGVTSYEGDTITYKWEIMFESKDLGWGGDFESTPETYLSEIGQSELKFTVPNKLGDYRLFIYATDSKGNAATANIPFLVK